MSTSDKELQDAFKRSQQVQKQNDGMSEKANARIRERVLAYNKAIESDSGIKRVFAATAANIRASSQKNPWSPRDPKAACIPQEPSPIVSRHKNT